MKNKKLKVFHGLVNYGTQAGLFAKGLREKGIDAISVSGPDLFKRQIDVELLHGGNWIEKIVKHSINWIRRFCWFFKYNTFHFYYGTTLFPKQMDLPFYKIFGKKIVFHYLGNDVQGYKISVEKYKWTNMQGFIGNKDPILYDKKIETRLLRETKYANLQLVCAPCYSEFVLNAKVLPLAIDISDYEFHEFPKNKIPLLIHAPTDRAFKGTDYILKAVDQLKKEGYKFDFQIIENVTHSELMKFYLKCDVFIDQVMGGWYGTAAIEAMALGRPVICSIRKSYFRYISFGDEIPIIHADPDNIYQSIKYVLDNRILLPELGKKSRLFVEHHHSLSNLTEDLISYYKQL